MTLDQLCYRLALTTAVHTQTVPLVLGYDSKIEKQKLFFHTLLIMLQIMWIIFLIIC